MDESDADAFEVEINAIELETIIDDPTFDYTESDAASTSEDSDSDKDDTSYVDALLGELFGDEDEENSNEASDNDNPVSVALGHLLASEEERIKAKQEYDRLKKEVDMYKRMMWYVNRPEVLAAARLTQQMGRCAARQNVGTQVRMADLVDEEFVQNSSGSVADYEDDDDDAVSSSEKTMGHPNWPMLENWYLNQMALRGVEEDEEEEFEAEDGEDTEEDEDSDQENVIYFDDGGEMYAATRQPKEMVEDEEAGYDAGDEAHFEVIDLEQEEASARARGEPHVGPACKRMRTK